jgi:hypothetical protein
MASRRESRTSAPEDVPLRAHRGLRRERQRLTPCDSAPEKAVKEFLAAVPNGDQVTLLGFATASSLTRRAVNPEERAKAVDRLAPWGATALCDVILRGVDMLGKQPGAGRWSYSATVKTRSHASITDVERRLRPATSRST